MYFPLVSFYAYSMLLGEGADLDFSGDFSWEGWIGEGDLYMAKCKLQMLHLKHFTFFPLFCDFGV